MICNKCNTENIDGVAFCKNCGESFNQQQQASYNYCVKPVKKKCNWCDICTIIGFVCSLAGYVTFWFVFSPLGLIGSIIGCKGNKTKGLAVTGVIISIIAIIVKVGFILYDLKILPPWLTSGVLV